MRREIKFRGLSIESGEWVYGDLCRFMCADEQVNLIGDPNSESTDDIQVNPQTVGQFTGLKDKNGKDIYEGDQVVIDAVTCYKSGTGTIVLREWEEGDTVSGENRWMKVKSGWDIETECHQIWTSKTIEVIGNIHEEGVSA